MRENLDRMVRYFTNKCESYRRFRPQFSYGGSNNEIWNFYEVEVTGSNIEIDWNNGCYQKVHLSQGESYSIHFNGGEEGKRYVLLLEVEPGVEITWDMNILWPEDFGPYEGSPFDEDDPGAVTVYTYIGFLYISRDGTTYYDALAISDNLKYA